MTCLGRGFKQKTKQAFLSRRTRREKQREDGLNELFISLLFRTAPNFCSPPRWFPLVLFESAGSTSCSNRKSLGVFTCALMRNVQFAHFFILTVQLDFGRFFELLLKQQK